MRMIMKLCTYRLRARVCVCVCAHALPLSRVLDEVIKVVMATGSMGEVFA